MCHRNIRMQSIAPPRQAQLASRAHGPTGSVWAKVRVCVRACVCVRAENSLRARSCTVSVCSPYICVFAWCVYAHECLRA